jgi:DNA-binding response OmpR family regulator
MSQKETKARPQIGAESAHQVLADEQLTNARPHESARILNVNENDANRHAIGRILKLAGFDVVEAATGAEALRHVANRADLVILDVLLPDIDGFEVCRRIKNDPLTKSIPVLHLSARHIRERERAPDLESGADGFLVLPVEQPELLSTVRNLLRLRDAQRAMMASARRVEELEKELAGLEQLAAAPLTPVTSRSYGTVPLREAQPKMFQELIGGFEQLFDLALQRTQYRVGAEVLDTVQALSDRLGFLRAGPRDVIDIYSAALKRKTAGAPVPRARAFIEEGRLLVLELMGHLVSYYRSAACAPVRRAPAGEFK